MWLFGFFFFFFYEAFHVESCLVTCSCVVVFFSVTTSLGKERAGLYGFRAFVYFVCATVCLFFSSQVDVSLV